MKASRLALAGLIAVASVAILMLAARHADSEAAAASTLGNAAQCERYAGLPAQFGPGSRAGMVKIPGGSYEPGSMAGYPDERLAGRVRVASLWMDRTEVTNAQFAAFVRATGHRTQAEREGATAVFRAPPRGQRTERPNSWWVWTPGADWRHPEGPASELLGRA